MRTPESLGLNQVQFDALITVRDRLRAGKVEDFTMFTNDGCIAGQIQRVLRESGHNESGYQGNTIWHSSTRYFIDHRNEEDRNTMLEGLFFPNPSSGYNANQYQAADAIDRVLEGQPAW